MTRARLTLRAQDAPLDEETLYAMLDAVRRHETIYKQAGAVHGCALCSGRRIDFFIDFVMLSKRIEHAVKRGLFNGAC